MPSANHRDWRDDRDSEDEANSSEFSGASGRRAEASGAYLGRGRQGGPSSSSSSSDRGSEERDNQHYAASVSTNGANDDDDALEIVYQDNENGRDNSSSYHPPSSSSYAHRAYGSDRYVNAPPAPPHASLSINELLSKALEAAANPGEGDEEPEVLPNPNEPHSQTEPMDQDDVGSDDDDEDDEATQEQLAAGASGDMMDTSTLQDTPHGGPKNKCQVRPKKQTGGSDMKRVRREPRLTQEQLAKRQAIEDEERKVAAMNFDENALIPPSKDMSERAKYIPLRLTYDERKALRLVNSAIGVSDYTNIVDVLYKNKSRRRGSQLQFIVSFMTGIVAANRYDDGQEVLKTRNFTAHAELLRNKLEIARRYKITNPEKFRSEYGKLIYLLQDTIDPEVQSLMQDVRIDAPIRTVYELCKERGALALLDDEKLATATQEILQTPDKDRYDIENEIRRKEKAVKFLVNKYTSDDRHSDHHTRSYTSYDHDTNGSHLERVHTSMTAEELRLCLYSLSDNQSFLNTNKRPIEECQRLLEKYFGQPSDDDPKTSSLAIDMGQEGARLSHSHAVQYDYVRQSLALWAAIIDDMFRLWYLAEQDLLSEKERYELRNTGQGLQRVQNSPLVYKAMHEILHRTKQSLGTWVGSSVIHLGDNNVPNALVFIDKYMQVSQILGPLINTLNNIDKSLKEDPHLETYFNHFGGVEKAKKDILRDFFMHGFDGSGGDNFFDAGSCIDGRLTSCWNWCSQIANKPYYPLFRLTGFTSFDGEFDR